MSSVLFTLMATQAWAGSTGLSEVGVLLAADESWPAGFTDPSVVYDQAGDQWHLFFGSTRADVEVDEGCGEARVIGHAVSDDGTSWAVDPEPVLVPAADWAPCGVSSPSVLETSMGWQLFYVGHTLGDEGPETAGLGRAEGEPDGFHPGVRIITDGAAADPSAVDVSGRVVLSWVAGGEVHAAESFDGGDTWDTLGAVLGATSFEWLNTGVAGAALVCREDMEVHPFALWLAGVSQLDEVSYGTAVSPDGLEWYVSSDPSATPDATWTGWDVVIAGEAQLVYFSRDGEVVLAATSDTWGEPTGRSCRVDEEPVEEEGEGGVVLGEDTADTASFEDTGSEPEPFEDPDEDDAGEVSGVEAGLDEEPGGCGCATGAPAGFLVLPALLGLARRRR